MKATFQLDPCYTLMLGGDIPPGIDQNLVNLQVFRQPMPTAIADGTFTVGTDKEPGKPVITGYTYPPSELVFGAALKPSQARAIASAILSAATESR